MVEFRPRLWVLALLVVLAGCKTRSTKAAPEAEVGQFGNSPRLVVVLTVDQLPTWTFNRDRPFLRGGLGRLVERGLFAPDAEFPYASTYTAPGHATIATGAPPSRTGILGNSWFSRSSGKSESCVQDPQYRTHGLPVRTSEVGVSSRTLRVEGVADVLERETSGQSHTVAVSLKDRGAILLLGKKPDLAIWYEPELPGMTSSTFYTETLPDWLDDFNDEQPVSRYRQVWTPTDPALLAKITKVRDDAIGEGKGFGFGRVFPHDLGKTERPTSMIRLTPMGTELLFDAAKAAVLGESLGQDQVPDLLAISVSSHDYAGHYWGQESWERLDLLLRLDQTIEGFLEFLDANVGAERYAIVLTSDHGANPMVERIQAAGAPAHRVSTLRLIQVAGVAASKVLGKGRWVSACKASSLYLTSEFQAQPEAAKTEAIAAITRALLAVPGMGYAKSTEQLRGPCDEYSGLDALACRSIGNESGEIFLAPSTGSSLSAGYQTGTSHGSPSREDRFVPVIVSAPGLEPRLLENPISMLQVAPTVSALLGIQSPPAATKEALIDPGSWSLDERATPRTPRNKQR